MVQFAYSLVAAGMMKRRKLLHPGKKRLRKWIMTSLNEQEGTSDLAPDHAEASVSSISLGASFQKPKDPEHLPPANKIQKFGDSIRVIPRILSSPEVTFGFRVGIATLSISIMAFLESTQQFFMEQRLVWAMIIVAISMTMTAGSGVFGFGGRVAGTFIASCLSLCIWYIGGAGAPAGVLVVLFVVLFIELYFFVSFPKFTVVFMISMVTQVLILGYELQVRKIGLALSLSSGQPYYQIYLLAPYRLATVAGGCLVAFIWTYFPFPITARNTLRRQLGESLMILANYYSCVHATVRLRVERRCGDPEDKTSPYRRLEKARDQLFGKEMALFAQLRQNSASTVFEPTLGGKFPKAQYDTIINEIQNILNYVALMAYTTRDYGDEKGISGEGKWITDFARVLGSIEVMSEETTSLLALLSASVTNSTPLPPYLRPPPPYQLSARLKEMDADILSIVHIAEPGYAAFAVRQVASSLINDDLKKLLDHIKELVGETDFSFHVVPGADSPKDALDKGKQD
ncbi:hypothetical protein MMC13_003519 [Lambiella insularis]|nr:hypothetical protein [Lambiella insularis]